jgi:NAD(P)-dependent dehydrogenase (short-subunit alcohol dehydrogenase family)
VSGELRFDGRVAVVSGAGRGLGREFALLLAARGAAVVVNDIGVSADMDRYDGAADASRRDVAQEVVDEIVAAGGRAVANTADISDPALARTIVDDAVTHFGRIDIVVNNAGVVITHPLVELSDRDLELTHAVHVRGAVSVLRAALPRMHDQGYGRIVNIASVEGGVIGSPEFEVYAAAKGSLMGLTRHLGGSPDVLVNAVLPGGRTRAALRSGRKRNDGVVRSAEAVAPPVAWLCHEDCAVSGKLFAVSAASVRQITTRVARGHRSPDGAALSVEDIAANWGAITARTNAETPRSFAEFRARWNEVPA